MTSSSPDHSPEVSHKSNRLAGETSPYLLQHATNPVDWYPWGSEAIARSKADNKPIFLSIGYSACHWCHVMERESFENPAIAAIMNEHFVNIKVDREERPDLDQIYMSAVMAMTGHGGWPMSVFLTPELKPFFGGTYFPPSDSRGMAGFPRVLSSVHQAWQERQEEIIESAAEMTRQLREFGTIAKGAGDLDAKLLDQAARTTMRGFDPLHGGFGHAPKFPHPMDLKVLLRHHARTGDSQALHIVRHTLDKMARGGIYDHLRGGFARYSTDDRWLAPHFEKMLYDNALLTSVYLEAYQATRDDTFGQVARETIDYILGRMTGPEGAFFSTEDADSEGVEGKYYVWTLAEVTEVLGTDRAKTFCYVYDITEQGNWEEHNILNLPRTISQAAKLLGRDEHPLRDELAECRSQLLAVRTGRVPPAKDTKVLVSWNGLMIAALSEGGRILKDDRCLGAARRAAYFILEHMLKDDGRLLHTYKDNQAKLDGYLDDYADLIDGLTRLYEATGEPNWIESALGLAKIMIDEFVDAEVGGFFFTGNRHEVLIARQKDVHDNATPSGNGMAATALVRLGALTGRDDLTQAGRRALESVQALLERQPAAAGQSLIALDFLLGAVREFAVIAGDDPDEFRAVLEAIATPFRPHKVVAPATPAQAAWLAEIVPLLANRPARDSKATTYVCEHFACREPVVGVAAIEAILAESVRDGR
jgi:uncharacterized protein YyaL (SSP411 family)